MPYINTKTTVSISKDQELALKEAFGKAIELIPGKSEAWLMLEFADNCRMAFKGTQSPDIAMLEVAILGKAKRADYDKLTNRLCSDVNRILGIPADRIYIKYSEHDCWGFNGINF
ncbi:MAG: hypothetical protein E7634_07335 [Ruminococcaceae bacterium]|nr:hypothetical protein [Oscillospiraceae bacterium]